MDTIIVLQPLRSIETRPRGENRPSPLTRYLFNSMRKFWCHVNLSLLVILEHRKIIIITHGHKLGKLVTKKVDIVILF